MNSLVDDFTVIGAFVGVIAFILSVLNAARNYLHIDLHVEHHDSNGDSFITALTSVDNKGPLGKKVEYAVILIGPEHESPVDTAKRMAVQMGRNQNIISFTNDISVLRLHSPVYMDDGTGALIPLPFFFNEQVSIQDETLEYRALIDKSKLASNVYYSARFFIFGKGRLHRSTHDLFKIS